MSLDLPGEIEVPDLNEEHYEIDGVPVVASPCVDPALTSVLGLSTMSFNLQTSGIAVQIQTTTPVNLQMADLQSKFEMLLVKLGDTEQRLDAAMRRIGFLEAQLSFKAEEISELSTRLLTVHT